MSQEKASLVFKTLSSLLRDIVDVPSVLDCRLFGLALDSREVHKGFLFIALSGKRFSADATIPSAIANGAIAVLREGESAAPEIEECDGVVIVRLPGLRKLLGQLIGRYFDHPSRKIKVIGVTGTNGKSSVTHYVAQLLNALGTKAGVIGTVGYGIPGQMSMSTHTTPDIFTTHRILAQLQEQGVEVVAMEVSSHGLTQGRVDGVEFSAAAFTNLSREHLDYHETMEEYGAAKRQLFRQSNLQYAVVNQDDEYGRDILAELLSKGAYPVYGFSAHEQADLQAIDVTFSREGILGTLVYGSQREHLSTSLLGAFNLENVMAATLLLCKQGYELPRLVEAIKSLEPVPGRMESFHRDGRTVIVDYAHTPDALNAALAALRPHCTGRLYCVFGCGGDRDKGKRALMGGVAESASDVVVLTNDNPRSEDPRLIIEDILVGIREPSAISIEMDREAAIKETFAKMKPDDLLLIAGKGHEDYQETNGQRLPYSDIAVVKVLMEAGGSHV